MIDRGRIRYRDTALEALGIVALVFALMLLSPGAVATFAAARVLGIALDVGQRWTFASASSVLALLGLCIFSGWRGLARYVVLSAMVAFVMLVARFGFRADWVIELFEWYRP